MADSELAKQIVKELKVDTVKALESVLAEIKTMEDLVKETIKLLKNDDSRIKLIVDRNVVEGVVAVVRGRVLVFDVYDRISLDEAYTDDAVIMYAEALVNDVAERLQSLVVDVNGIKSRLEDYLYYRFKDKR